METKVLEFRDEATMIPLLCIDMNMPGSGISEAQYRLMRRVGFPLDGQPNIMVTKLAGGARIDNDPYSWNETNARGFGDAWRWAACHNWIIENWHKLKDGDVVDARWIHRETAAPCEPDA